MPDNLSTPQFSTAQYSDQSSAHTCKVCRQPITGTFYRANGAAVCGRCADRVKREVPQDNHARFVRALVFGFGGYAIGLVLYAGFVIATGISIGYIALAVGWIVGKAMILGSGGVGGRRYQIVAVLLTYAAVSMAFIPIAIHYLSKEKKNTPAQTQQQQAARETAQPGGQSGQPEQTQQADADKNSGPKLTLAGWLGKVALIGLASPFLELQEGFSGLIGLIILVVGMQFAWKMTAGRGNIAITGPFEKSATASA